MDRKLDNCDQVFPHTSQPSTSPLKIHFVQSAKQESILLLHFAQKLTIYNGNRHNRTLVNQKRQSKIFSCFSSQGSVAGNFSLIFEYPLDFARTRVGKSPALKSWKKMEFQNFFQIITSSSKLHYCIDYPNKMDDGESKTKINLFKGTALFKLKNLTSILVHVITIQIHDSSTKTRSRPWKASKTKISPALWLLQISK